MTTTIAFMVDNEKVNGKEGEPYGMQAPVFFQAMIDLTGEVARLGDGTCWMSKDARLTGQLTRHAFPRVEDEESADPQMEYVPILRIGVVVDGYAAWVDSLVEMLCQVEPPLSIAPAIVKSLHSVFARAGVLPWPVSRPQAEGVTDGNDHAARDRGEPSPDPEGG